MFYKCKGRIYVENQRCRAPKGCFTPALQKFVPVGLDVGRINTFRIEMDPPIAVVADHFEHAIELPAFLKPQLPAAHLGHGLKLTF